MEVSNTSSPMACTLFITHCDAHSDPSTENPYWRTCCRMGRGMFESLRLTLSCGCPCLMSSAASIMAQHPGKDPTPSRWVDRIHTHFMHHDSGRRWSSHSTVHYCLPVARPPSQLPSP